MAESARVKVAKVRLGLETEDYLDLPEEIIPEQEIEYASVPAEFWDLPFREPVEPEKVRLRDKLTWQNIKMTYMVMCVVVVHSIYNFVALYLIGDRL